MRLWVMLAFGIASIGQAQTLRNVTFNGGVSFYRPANLVITNCTFQNGGVIVYGGGYPLSGTIDIERNHFSNCLCAIQLDGVTYDPNVTIAGNQIDGDAQHTRNDQISIYNSSGSLVRSIVIRGNFINWSVSAPIVPFAGGIVLDYESAYVLVTDNICINVEIGASWTSGAITNVLAGNTVLGIGASGAWTAGMAIVPNGAYVIANVVGWINSETGLINNYVVQGGPYSLIQGNGNVNLSVTDITDSAEQALYWRWANEMVSASAWPVGAF